MAELTDEQVKKAFEAFHRTEGYEGIRAAAPFLQFPIDAPTGEEEALFENAVRYDMSSHVGRAIGDACTSALRVFVKRRNLHPKKNTPDPRIQAVKGVLEVLTDEGGRIFSEKSVNQIAERILYWIDEVK